MITVISIIEFERLLQSKRITKSDNTEFIHNDDLRQIIMQGIEQVTGQCVTGGFITVLCGVDSDVDSSLLAAHSNQILLKLPRPKDPIYLSLPDDLSGVRISSQTLRELIPLNLSDSQLNSLAKEMFLLDTTDGSEYDYAFLNQINLSDVRQVIYSPQLETRVATLKKLATYEDLVFTHTNLFNRG